MKTEDVFIAHPETKERTNALKAIAKAFKMKFKVTKEKPYNSKFVAKIQESRQEIEDGKSIRVEKEDLKEFLGLK